MIRCVGAALRGDGNPPEVPVIRTVLRAYNGVWGVPIKHMSAALCAHNGGGRSPTMFYPRLSKMGLRPISSGAVRPKLTKS